VPIVLAIRPPSRTVLPAGGDGVDAVAHRKLALISLRQL